MDAPARTERQFLGPRMTRLAFLTLAVAFGLNLAAGQFFAPLKDAYGWHLSTLSEAVALNLIMWGLLQPVMGRAIDRFGARPVITASAALMGASFLLAATMTELWQFFLYYGILTAIGFAGCGSMANSVLVSRWYARRRAAMLARSSMGINIGQLLLLPLAGAVIAAGGFRAAFAVLGGLMLFVVAPAVWILARNDPADVGQHPDGVAGEAVGARPSAQLSEALSSRDFWLPTLGFVTCGYTLYLVAIHLPHFAEDLGGGLALGGRLLGIAAAASAVSMWVCGQAAQSWGARRPLVALYLVRAVGLALFATASSIGDLYVAAVVYGVSSMPIIPLVTRMIGDRFGANAMGSILGSTWLLHQVFAAAGVFLGGYLRSSTGDYRAAFWSGVGLLLAGAAVTALGGRRAKVPPLGAPAMEPAGGL